MIKKAVKFVLLDNYTPDLITGPNLVLKAFQA